MTQIRTTILHGFIALITASLGYGQVPSGRPPAQEFDLPAGISYTVHQYRESAPLRAGQLGIAYPKNAEGKMPMVVCIHGGGWSKGDKDQMAWMAIRYAQMGYVGVTVSYRLNHESPVPACVFDVKEAIRYLKSISSEIHANPNRIGLVGYSAGAHLALLTGLSPEAMEFKSDAHSEYDSSIQCVVGISTPADLEERQRIQGHLKFLPKKKSADAQFIRSLSPLHWVHAGQIPILMLHGDADKIVPAYNYQNFTAKCTRLGIENFELYVEKGGNHTFFFQQQKTTQGVVDRFLAKHLR